MKTKLPSVVIVCDLPLIYLSESGEGAAGEGRGPAGAQQERGGGWRRDEQRRAQGQVGILSVLGDIIHPCTTCVDSIVRPRHRREAGDGVETESGSSQPVKDERQVSVENI